VVRAPGAGGQPACAARAEAITLRVEHLTVDVAGRPVVDGASFEARPGELVAIVGPNGAGKTTLLEAIVGVRPSRGRVLYDGASLDSFGARAATFAYMPDEAALAEEATVETLLRAARRDARSVDEIARRFDVAALLRRGGRELSRGEAKRVWLAATTLLERPVLVLDEPFGAFDPLQLDVLLPVVREALGERGTALATIHQLSIAERIADRVVIVDAGRVLASGTLDELRVSAGADGAPLEEVFRALLRRRSDDAAT
jgi:ABC-type multidrug transport system ATPase subunit